MMSWTRLLSTRRLRRLANKPTRPDLNPFFEDEDRIVFSQPFRRLKDKTQVHPLSDNDHVRTRLTHSLEVATIGHALGSLVGKEIFERYRPQDIRADDIGKIVRAACLAHDIGNPPFGHTGETAICEWFKEASKNRKSENLLFGKEMSPAQKSDFYNFDGNAQGFRIVTQTENYKNKGGLQLTYATLGALMKYPWPSNANPKDESKFGFYQSEKQYAEEVAKEVGLLPNGKGGWCRHPLAYLVEAADDICYAIIDLEDGIFMGALRFEDLECLAWEFLKADKYCNEWREQYNKLDADDAVQKISFLRSKIITCLVEKTVKTFKRHETDLLKGTFNGELLDSPSTKDFVKTCKSIAQKQVFLHEKKIYLETASYTVLHGLLKDFSDAAINIENPVSQKEYFLIRLMARDKPKKEHSRYQRLRKVVDFISGMTDRYALGMFRQLTGISVGGMTPAPLELIKSTKLTN
jgi:dGTPase